MKMIDKLYLIVHPAYSMGAPEKLARRSPQEVEAFIEQTILPIIIKAQHDPNSMVILLRTAFGISPKDKQELIATRRLFPRAWSNPKTDQQRLRAYKLERELRNIIRKLLGPRQIILRTTKVLDEQAAEIAANQLKRTLTEKGVLLSPAASMETYGSYWELCSSKFSEKAYETLGIRGRLRVPESGSIRYSLRLPKEKFAGRAKRLYTKHLRR